jgi:hypothetical protein
LGIPPLCLAKGKEIGPDCCYAKPLSEAFFSHLLFDKIKAKNRQGNFAQAFSTRRVDYQVNFPINCLRLEFLFDPWGYSNS